MKRPLIPVLLVIILSLLLSACAPARSSNPAWEEAASAPSEAPLAPDMEMPATDTSSGGSLPVMNEPQTRLVVRNANLTIVVGDPAKGMDEIARIAESMGGFVVSSQLYKSTTRNGIEIPQADIQVRVPAEKLNEALGLIKAMVKDPTIDVRSENVSGQDVTKEYTDSKSRLNNLEAAEKKLQEIMDDTKSTKDVLAVYTELISIREQIEVIKGQIKYYEESAALSAVSVRLQAEESVEPIQIGGWKPVGVARDALQALVDTLKFIANAGIWLVIFFLPIALLLFLAFLVLRAIFRKVFKPRPRVVKPEPTPTPTEEEPKS